MRSFALKDECLRYPLLDPWGNEILQPNFESFGRKGEVGFDLEVFADLLYVYYLVRDSWDGSSEVVYVGQTGSVLGRLGAHRAGQSFKEFDRVLLRICQSKNEMNDVEGREIRRFQPLYNKLGTSNYNRRQRARNQFSFREV